MPSYIIHEAPASHEGGTVLRGAVRELWGYKGPEAMVAGPAETGKTYGGLTKVHALLFKYPGCQGALVRQTQKSIVSSVLQTYTDKILGNLYRNVVKPYGGETPEWFDYPNGSRLWIGGLDNPDKVLSSERDFVYVNQAEEITMQAWEFLLTRTTGRAGHMPYAQVLGDCNPGPASHWIVNRPTLKLFHSKHEDNPTLFDDDGNITEQGVKSLTVLESLTGVTKSRLRYGLWVSAEGVIYDKFNKPVHVIPRSEVPVCTRRLEIVDFGFINPFCWQNWYLDNDNTVYITQEVYYTQRLVEDHCKRIKKITRGQFPPEKVLADHDAEDRATFERHRGYRTFPADKNVSMGIQLMQKRLEILPNGKARFYYVEDALDELDDKLKATFKPTNSVEETEVYIWNEKKDAPVKEFDHGMDSWRYGAMYLDKPRSKKRRNRSFNFTTA